MIMSFSLTEGSASLHKVIFLQLRSFGILKEIWGLPRSFSTDNCTAIMLKSLRIGGNE